MKILVRTMGHLWIYIYSFWKNALYIYNICISIFLSFKLIAQNSQHPPGLNAPDGNAKLILMVAADMNQYLPAIPFAHNSNINVCDLSFSQQHYIWCIKAPPCKLLNIGVLYHAWDQRFKSNIFTLKEPPRNLYAKICTKLLQQLSNKIILESIQNSIFKRA
jgi:hypothetical protein